MLWKIKIHRPPHQADIADFVRLCHGFTPTPTWITEHAHQLGFRSKRPQQLAVKYARHDKIGEGTPFLEEMQKLWLSEENKSSIVFMDQISFWDSGFAIACYGVIGGQVVPCILVFCDDDLNPE